MTSNELSKEIIDMTTKSRILVLAAWLLAATNSQCEIKRENVVDLPSSRVVYDFLSALRMRYSMVSSKALFPFIANNKEVSAIKADENAWVETVLVEEVLSIEEEVGNEVVTAIVRTEEHNVEVWTFRVELKGNAALIVPSKARDKLPRLTPWIIRITNIAEHRKTDPGISSKK